MHGPRKRPVPRARKWPKRRCSPRRCGRVRPRCTARWRSSSSIRPDAVRVVLVGLGGAAGSIVRYWMSGAVQGLMSTQSLTPFPLGTLTVNVVGCLIIGAIAQLAEQKDAISPDARALLV